MELTSPQPEPHPDEVLLLQQVQQQWNSGDQMNALSALRNNASSERPWVAALLSWLLMQQGGPSMDESINWALQAARSGYSWQLTHAFNNAVAHLSNHPQLANRLPELMQAGLPWGGSADPIGQGWNLVAQGQPQVALQIMRLSGPDVLPMTDQHLASLLERTRTYIGELESAVTQAHRAGADVATAASEAQAAIAKARDGIDTSAKQAGLLVSTVSSDATNALFKADAQRNARESRGAWVAGLVVLGAAALVAVLPVVLHYLRLTSYSSWEAIGVHLVSTAALGTFAGVLLARARARDQAAQRASDLSTAMGTMISYSNQISDPAEKQRFMMMMGQVVLQAHLTSGPSHGVKDDQVSGMVTLANLIKPGTFTNAANQSQ